MLREPGARQLAELLQEQQEPFTLQVYLLERGYLKTKYNSPGTFRRCSCSTRKFLKRSAGCGLNKRRKVITNCSKIARALFNKLVSVNSPKTSDQNVSVAERTAEAKKTEETQRDFHRLTAQQFSVLDRRVMQRSNNLLQKGHTTTSADTCQACKLDNLENHTELSGCQRQEASWGCVEDNKQLSPVSVLEEIQSEEGSPAYNTRHNETRQEETETSATSNVPKNVVPWNNPVIQKPSLDWYKKKRRVLQQSNQLPFDCVREVIETQGQKDPRWQRIPEFLGPEELGRLLLENLWPWSEQHIDETRAKQRISLVMEAAAEEWNAFEQQTREVGVEIAGAILEDMSHDIVNDMINLISQNMHSPT